MSRILAVARRIYGDDACHRIFEPLVADALSDHQSLGSRVRWYAAVVSTFVVCLPRATFERLSRRFAIDLAVRASAFFALAFALQWSLGAQLKARSAEAAWPPSFATTFFFVIAPVMWRLRREPMPAHQQRLLAVAFSTMAIGAAWVSAAPDLTLGAALFLGTVWLTWSSWRAFTAFTSDGSTSGHAWLFVYPALSIIVASVPVKLALGISLWRPWWPGDNLIPYVIGAAVAWTSGVRIGDAGYRKGYSNPTSIFKRPRKR
jgi:hypothetical protein